ncbi:MAG TPA: hypothetical protein VKK61_04830 [Tepidisphaeraceae bacterium]|jgi:hypothetical protein|nr:hypothetical protein [Tepidisphaeraceae bacterium]
MPQPLDILLPAAISLIVLLISWRPWTRKNIPGRWGGPIALAGGFLAMYSPVTGAIPKLPPNGAIGWIFYIAIVTALLALIDIAAHIPSLLRWIGWAIVFAASFSALLFNQLNAADTRHSTIGFIAVFTLVAIGWLIAIEQNENDRLISPISMFLSACFAAALLIMSHSIVYGRLALILAGAIAPMILLGAWRGRFTIRGSAPVFVAVLGVLLAAGYYFADLTVWNLTLVGIAPLTSFVVKIPALSRKRPWVRGVICIALLIFPLLIAVGLATPEFLHTMSDESSDYGQ